MLKFHSRFICCFNLLLLCFSGTALADPAVGAKLFNRHCKGCHMIGPDAANQFGPQLNGVFQRAPANLIDYSYSSAFEQTLGARLAWDEATLDNFLYEPLQYIEGTKMAFPGVKSPVDRQELISYLQSVGPDGVLPTVESLKKAIAAKKNSAVLPKDAEIPEHGVLHLGRLAQPKEIIAWDIDVRPDGQGLPEGRGTVEDGTELYDTNCAVCHGVFGEGVARWPVLAGGEGTLAEDRPEKTIGSYWPYLSTVFDYIRRAMPFGNARTLLDDEVYALTAYLLYLNDLVEEDFELNSENFSSIRMPNETNFIVDNRHLEQQNELAADLCMKDCFAEPAKVLQRARILDVTPENEDDDEEAVQGAID